jgi:plasmid stabilization system protein ParE
MSKQIVWSPLAESDLDRILEYLNENWDQKVTNQSESAC